MKPREEDVLERWLGAEARGADEEAEAALAELFSSLPDVASPAGFAAAVVARRRGEARSAARRRRWLWVSAATAVPAVIVAWLLVLSGLGSGLSRVVGWSTAGLAAAGRGLAEGISAAAIAGKLAEVVGALATSLPGAALLLASALVAAAALRCLFLLFATERSWSYADTH